MGIFEQRDVANLRTDGLHHLLTVGTGEADRRSLADTGSERNGLRPAIHQHLGAGYGTLAGTAAAAHEADDLTFTERFETSLSFGRRDKIRRAGAQILSLLTADDTDLFSYRSLLFSLQKHTCPPRPNEAG